jgi:hypothetical protein
VPRGTPIGGECDLFDRDGEPSDQPCDLVQLAGIMILKRSSQASETFVVAHRGRFARDDRRHLPFEIGLELWHRITSRESGIIENLRRISHFGVSWRQDWQPCYAATSGWRFSFREKPDNSLRHREIEATPEVRQTRPFPALQAPGALLYAGRCEPPLRTLGFRPVPR